MRGGGRRQEKAGEGGRRRGQAGEGGDRQGTAGGGGRRREKAREGGRRREMHTWARRVDISSSNGSGSTRLGSILLPRATCSFFLSYLVMRAARRERHPRVSVAAWAASARSVAESLDETSPRHVESPHRPRASSMIFTSSRMMSSSTRTLLAASPEDLVPRSAKVMEGGRYVEICGDVGRFGENWGGVGRCRT